MQPMTVFIELLTLRTWLAAILPRLVWWRIRGQVRVARCYAIDTTLVGAAAVRFSRWLTGVAVEPLRFRMVDVQDEQGLLLRLRIAYQDLGEVQRDIMEDARWRRALGGLPPDDRLRMYMAKALAVNNAAQRQTLWRALWTIQVCAWQQRQAGLAGQPVRFFLEQRVWQDVITRYAARNGITVVPVSASVALHTWRKWLLTPVLKRHLYRWQVRGFFGRRIPKAGWVSVRGSGHGSPRGSRIGVEYYGHLNLDRPECYSDAFFWQQGGLPARDMVFTFNMDSPPLNDEKLAQLSAHGIEGVAVRPRVAASSAARVFVPRAREARDRRQPVISLGGREGRWMRMLARTYGREERAFWRELFTATGIKVYVSWFRYHESHCAVAEALKDAGGVFTVYQRAYDTHPSAEIAVAADVVFAFSRHIAEIEARSRSMIPYLVVTGYLGDFRFPLLRPVAARVRARLQQHGATRIVAFADENFSPDERWHTGPSRELESYRFLLERVLAEPWLGVILKPKTPATLRRRLGPVAELLVRAESTGRCFLFEEGPVQGSFPPAAAALAADLMIHGHLNAATAGLDAALAGVPTLLVDRFGWSTSPLYQLGVGRVVFTDWEQLWQACQEHWQRPGGIPGFGDWSSMLDHLDPFRDGRAAERMATYLGWLLEGFRAGRDRETVMADAADRYAAHWGQDKVVERINTRPGAPSREPVRVSPLSMAAA